MYNKGTTFSLMPSTALDRGAHALETVGSLFHSLAASGKKECVNVFVRQYGMKSR